MNGTRFTGFRRCLTCLLIFTLTGGSRLAAQSLPPVIEVSQIRLSDSIEKRAFFFADSSRHMSAADLPRTTFQPQPPRNMFHQLNMSQVEKDWWLELNLRNSSDSPQAFYLIAGLFLRQIDLYRQDSASKLVRALPRQLPESVLDSLAYRALSIPPHSQGLYYARLQFVNTSTNILNIRLVRDYYINSYSRNLRNPSNNSTMYSYIIVGILLMMIFYSLAVFILNNSLEFLYYACFALLMAILFFLKSFLIKTSIPFNFFFEAYLDFVIQGLGTFFYLIFLRKFIEAKKYFPLIDQVFLAGQYLIIVSLALFSWFNFFTLNSVAQDLVENLTKYIWTLTTVIFIVYAILKKNRLLNYLAVGHLIYLLAGILSLVLISNPAIFNIPIGSIWRDALFYYEIGLTVELIFFLMALAFKSRRDIIDRTRERERLKLENERKEFEKQLAIVEAKQEERDRISTDMHDELGSGVTAIRLMSEIVKTKMKGNILPEIEKISNSANELLGKMNTIIWTMSSSNDKLDNLVAYTRSYALEFFENTPINCHFSNPEEIPSTEVSGEKRRNIFLCIKEALNNVAKHSNAKDVWIRIRLLEGQLEINIHDNGVGINLAKLREFGNGLTNMRKRMERVDGIFYVENKEGTTTIFTVPL